jgi:hypothetical protein
MGVKVRKKDARWYVLVDYHGRRKSKCIGSREAAEQVRRQVEAKLALGDLSVLDTADDKKPTFNTYADGWLKDYAGSSVKPQPPTVTKVFSTSIYDRGSARSYLLKSGATTSKR